MAAKRIVYPPTLRAERWTTRLAGQAGVGYAGWMLTLYYAPGSSSMAPHIALHEIGASFEARAVSFARKETQSPAFLAINPRGKVPVLLIDGRPLTEVAGILFYLARAYPEAGLLPSGDEAEGQVVSWMSFIASGIHPVRREGPARMAEMFAHAERLLGGRDWAVGDAYSIADIHPFRLYWRYVNGSDVRRDEFPALEAHYGRMMARPAVQKTIEIERANGYELP